MCKANYFKHSALVTKNYFDVLSEFGNEGCNKLVIRPVKLMEQKRNEDLNCKKHNRHYF